MSNLPTILNRNSMASNPMRDLPGLQRRMEMRKICHLPAEEASYAE